MVAPGHRAWSHLLRRARSVSISEAVRAGPWAVLAPHPDDEALGCGALMATLTAAGGIAHTAFLTDGAGSHPGAPGWTPNGIARLRAREAREALVRLGSAVKPLHLDWSDASPASPRDPAFMRSAATLAAWCRRHHIRRIAVTWSGEPHCDHEAAAALAVAAAAQCGARVLFYLVWGWTDPVLIDRVASLRALSIDTGRQRPRQHRAIRCHRSQLGGRIVGATERFRLPRTMLRLADRPRTILLEACHAP